MATFASLDGADKLRVQQYVDHLHRPAILAAARLFNALAVSQAGLLASPSGATSTASAPAADSVAGLLGSLDAGEVVPLLDTGLAGAQPLLAAMVSAQVADIAATLAAHNDDAHRQSFALAVGSVNITATA